MKSLALLLSLALIGSAADRRVSFNDGWKFAKGELAGAEHPSFNDSGWRALTLPHDWAIEGPFDVKNNPNTGGLPVSGTGWYRKHFAVAAATDRYYSLEFDGAMSNSTVFVNGKEAGGRPYGYSSFSIDLTPHLRRGQDNVISVRLKPEDDASRWYPGAGIYRNVWLVTTGAVHVGHWGSYVTTPDAGTVVVKTDVRNSGAQAARVTVETVVVDAQGRQIAIGGAQQTIAANASATAETRAKLGNAHRWDMDDPYLYSAVTTIRSGQTELDRYVTPFGIRTVEFTREHGFVLNGRVRKLNGVCNHHDLGALGAAVNRRATERQIEIMKSMGVNAIRTSHNPPSPELLELCDRMGVVVMDEAFDMWRIPKVKNGLSKYFDEWSERDLRDLIRRDRNHPSVVLWSIGNEVPEQRKANGWEVAKRLTDIAHSEDPTRPTTAAFNDALDAIKNELADHVDVPGFNYKPKLYEQVRKNHPKWVVYGSETESCVSSRGVYELPLQLHNRLPSLQVSGFDIEAPPWAYCPDVEFDAQDRLPNLAGEFVWTGFDYLGEPTPYGRDQDWPSRSSYFGIVDLAGFPKDRFYLYKSHWTTAPVLHLLPHWNWTGREGQVIPVMAYTNAEEVELFLNGKSLGRKKLGVDTVTIPVGPNVSESGKFTSKYRLSWDVPYAPGTLRAVGYRGGKQVSTEEVRTAGAPAKVKLIVDRPSIHADGEDLAFVTVRIEDRDGNFCPLADNLVKFHVTGAGKVEAVDNGNAASLEPFQADHRKAFNGLALLIVRSTAGRPGKIQVEATADGLKNESLIISTSR